MKQVFGVFGDPVGHSLSPAMHSAAFSALSMDCIYHAFRVRPEKLGKAILGAEAMGFGGLNLTVPLKEEALKLDFIKPDPLAKRIGAINTVVFEKSGIQGITLTDWEQGRRFWIVQWKLGGPELWLQGQEGQQGQLLSSSQLMEPI